MSLPKKYYHAKTLEGTIINITDVDKSLKNKYLCICCGDEMIARKGEIKIHHFAHKHANCNYESYLHTFAKMKFAEVYSKCVKGGIPFYIDYQIIKTCNYCKLNPNIYDGTCLNEESWANFDITKIFNIISIEKKHKSGFIPDVLLESTTNDESIFVEIAVTHECEKNKINTGNRIIELNIQCENDISSILRKSFEHSDPSVSFYNFKKSIIEKSFKQAHACDEEFSIFILFKTGKASILHKPLKDLLKDIGYENQYYELINDPQRFSFSDKIRKLAFEGKMVKNCYACRFYACNKNIFTKDLIFCKKKRASVSNSNQAADCLNYWLIEKMPEKKGII